MKNMIMKVEKFLINLGFLPPERSSITRTMSSFFQRK